VFQTNELLTCGVEGTKPNDIRKEEMFKQLIAFNDILPPHKLLLSIGVLPATAPIRTQRVCKFHLSMKSFLSGKFICALFLSFNYKMFRLLLPLLFCSRSLVSLILSLFSSLFPLSLSFSLSVFLCLSYPFLSCLSFFSFFLSFFLHIFFFVSKSHFLT
jgi:hypothetical protein